MRGTRSEPLVHVPLLLRIWRCRRALLGRSSNDDTLALQAHRRPSYTVASAPRSYPSNLSNTLVVRIDKIIPPYLTRAHRMKSSNPVAAPAYPHTQITPRTTDDDGSNYDANRRFKLGRTDYRRRCERSDLRRPEPRNRNVRVTSRTGSVFKASRIRTLNAMSSSFGSP